MTHWTLPYCDNRFPLHLWIWFTKSESRQGHARPVGAARPNARTGISSPKRGELLTSKDNFCVKHKRRVKSTHYARGTLEHATAVVYKIGFLNLDVGLCDR